MLYMVAAFVSHLQGTGGFPGLLLRYGVVEVMPLILTGEP
jgi:hypothetical protein